jgi:hypothetical protein
MLSVSQEFIVESNSAMGIVSVCRYSPYTGTLDFEAELQNPVASPDFTFGKEAEISRCRKVIAVLSEAAEAGVSLVHFFIRKDPKLPEETPAWRYYPHPLSMELGLSLKTLAENLSTAYLTGSLGPQWRYLP